VKKGKKVIAIAGNPNCGKTALFNNLTGGNQHIGNWPGVTVDKIEGELIVNNEKILVVDLPGIYSFSANSDDERAARDYILSGEPDLIVNVIDSTNIERNLYLTSQLIEMKVPVMVVLNMIDLAERNHMSIDTDFIEKTLSSPVIAMSAMSKRDNERLKSLIGETLSKPLSEPDITIDYPNEIEDIIKLWDSRLFEYAKTLGANSRWLSVKLLEGDEWLIDRVSDAGILKSGEITDAILSIKNILKDTPDILIAEYRYGLITGLTKKAVHKKIDRISISDKIDSFVMNKFLGIPIFFFVMYLVFWVAVTFGSVFIDFFDILFGAVFVDGFSIVLENFGSPEWLKVILAGGVGAGIQTVSTFIPVIFFMFLMLSLLEDSGYMSRAAFVMDGFMKVLGLPGKAFVPMIVGFGCTVPAILGTKILESRKDRFLTIFMCPLMSCGARLPVYALFGAAFFGESSGKVVFSIYLVGILMAVFTGLIFKKTVFHGEYSQFVMELPAYHAPRFKHIMIHTWIRLKMFIIRAGKVIVLLVIILSLMNSISTDFKFGNTSEKDSLLAKVGKTITPIFTPMGIEKENWPAVAALFTGLFAKESVVGTLTSLYSQIYMTENINQNEEIDFDFSGEVKSAFMSIPQQFSAIFIPDDLSSATQDADNFERSIFTLLRQHFNIHSAYAFLLFVLIYFPCVAALAAAIRELKLFYGLLLPVYLTVLAWITATLYYQISSAREFIWILIPVLMLIALYGALKIVGRREKKTVKSQ
jgi:ferrous iron transport protein B